MATRPCPNCRAGMAEVAAPGIVADVCRLCGGVWLDRGELQRLALSGAHALAALDTAPTGSTAPDVVPAGGVAVPRAGTLRCPQCGETLLRVSHREAPELQIAGCRRCGGLWLPHGQLSACARRLAQPRRPPPVRSGVLGGQPARAKALPGTPASRPAPTEPLPGGAPAGTVDRLAIPVGRVFRPSLGRLAGFSLLYAVGLGFVSIFVTLGLTRRPDAGPYVPFLWAVGGSIPILYPLGRFWLRSGQSVTVEPDALVQRTRFGACRSPFAAIVRLRHEGNAVVQPYRHRGYDWDWDDFIDPTPLVVGHDIEFEVITEGDWRNNVTFTQDYADWEELVALVTRIIEARTGPGGVT